MWQNGRHKRKELQKNDKKFIFVHELQTRKCHRFLLLLI